MAKKKKPAAKDFASLYKENPRFHILHFDSYDDHAVRLLKLTRPVRELRMDRTQQAILLEDLRLHQRLLRIEYLSSGDGKPSSMHGVAEKLKAAGFRSANHIARIPRHAFIREYGHLFDNNLDKTAQVYDAAKNIAARTTHIFANLHHTIGSPHFMAMRSANVHTSLADYYGDIPGYQQLFGSLNYIGGDHCTSIFGPAAYFLDLMRITDDYITDPNSHKDVAAENIPFAYLLSSRRPDLFELELNCANSNDLVPYLQIVNEVLERRIMNEWQISGKAGAVGPATITLDQSASTADSVYNNMRITITGGPGTGQERLITAYVGNTREATVDSAWSAPIPDQTSTYNIASTLDITGEALGATNLSISLAKSTPGGKNAYAGMRITITGGNGAGQTRTITDYDDVKQVAIVDRAWSTPPPAAKSLYRINHTPWQSLAVAKYPLNLPFNLPLCQIRQFLGSMSVALTDVYNKFNHPLTAGRVVRATTGTLTPQQDGLMKGGPQVNQTIEITRGTGAGQVRRIRSFSKTSRALTIDQDWDQLPDTTSEYVILDSLPADREYIGLSIEEYNLIVTPQTARTGLKDFYPVTGTEPDNRVDAFLDYTGLDWKQLDALLVQGLSKAEMQAGLAAAFFINNTGEAGFMEIYLDRPEDDPEDEVYRIRDLTWKRVDRVNRFLRLSKVLGWNYAALDCALASVGSSEITRQTIELIAGIKFLNLNSTFSIEELCSFWSNIKTTGKGNGIYPQDMFDRIFNNPTLLNGQNPYTSNPPIPFDPSRPLDWIVSDIKGTNGIIRSRLSAALQLDDNSLVELGNYVSGLVGSSPGTLALNLPNLSWLYRLAKAASYFQLKVDGYLLLLDLINQVPSGNETAATVPGVDGVLRQWEQARWYRSAPFTIYEINYLLNGKTSAYYKAPFKKDDLVPLLQNLWVASESARLKKGSFNSADVDAKKSVEIFDLLKSDGFINADGILINQPAIFETAANNFLLAESSFPVPQSTEVYKALQECNPKILLTSATPGKLKLSSRYNDNTPLDFLYPNDSNADYNRSQVRSVLSGTRRNIQLEEYAFLFPLSEESFVNGKIDATAAADVFALLKTIVPANMTRPILSEPLLRTVRPTKGLLKLEKPIGYLNPEFNDKTPLDFLFSGTPAKNSGKAGSSGRKKATASRRAAGRAVIGPSDAELKRSIVRKILLGQKNNINSVVEMLNNSSLLQQQTFLNGVASFLDTTTEILGAALPFVKSDKDVVDYLPEFLKPATKYEVGEPVYSLVTDTFSAVTIFTRIGFTPAEMRALLNKPGAFNLDKGLSRTYHNVQRLTAFKALQKGIRDNSDVLITCFYLPQDTAGDQSRVELLAGITGWNQEQLKLLSKAIGCGYDNVASINRLKGCFDITLQAELDVNSLLQLEALGNLPLADTGWNLIQDNWRTYVHQSDILQAAVSARFSGEESAKSYTDNTAAVNVLKRDALLGFSIWLLNKNGIPMKKPSDLYQYLLIDVEMSGCDSISYIAQGISSVQLYMQRCLMMLERCVTNMSELPDTWWKWMSSYRMWEANRKVFLYPENYINPTLRKDPTPTFRNFADALLQTNIDETAVGDAYKNYFAELGELASLVNCESCQCKRKVPGLKAPLETLFLFGRTNKQPYTYYYRSFDNQSSWTPWEKLDITINSLYISPVFAFDRLFVFWTELEEIETSKMENNNSIPISSVSASIKYSYVDDQGKWIQPQVLRSGIIINYECNYALDKYAQDRLEKLAQVKANDFNIDQPCWQAPNAIQLPAGAFSDKKQYPSTECILVNYGFRVRVVRGDASEPQVPEPSLKVPTAQLSFDTSLYDFVTVYNNLRKNLAADKAVELTFLYPIYVDSNLNVISLPTTYPAAPPGQNCPRYRPGLARTQNKLAMFSIELSNVIDENYYPDDFAQCPAAPESLPSDVLLGNVAGEAASVITVKNKPGRFIFDNGDEAFLVTFAEKSIPYVSEDLDVLVPAISTPPAEKFVIWSEGYYNTKEFKDLSFDFTRLNSNVVGTLANRLMSGGIDNLLSIVSQETSELPFNRFSPYPGNVVAPPEKLDFRGAYGQYFWETFFHGPFLVAATLSMHKRHEEARKWYQYIYNPTQQPGPFIPIGQTQSSKSDSERFWRFLPFRTMKVEDLTEVLTDRAQIAAYNNSPFNPDAIARLRISAYAKTIVMHYIDNLIEWADRLYEQDSRESITEAVNLYVMASDLLGERPQQVGQFATPDPRNFNDIKKEYSRRTIAQGKIEYAWEARAELASGSSSDENDAYDGMYITITAGKGAGPEVYYIESYDGSTHEVTITTPWKTRPDNTSEFLIYQTGIPEFLVRLENSESLLVPKEKMMTAVADQAFNNIDSYFSIPENQEFISYWDKIDDRLYKIRHCMNISGQVRSLALYEPPIDPRAAVSGAAAERGTTSAMQIPLYRFAAMIERAKSLVSTLTNLGSTLLSVLEKKDAEALSLLRATQEKTMLSLLTYIKEQQIEELIRQQQSLNANLKNATIRNTYYNGLIAAGLSPAEITNLVSTSLAMAFSTAAGIMRTLSAIGYAIPQVGSPFAMTYGGQQIGAVLSAESTALELGTTVSTYVAQLSLTMAGYQRRESDWRLQADLAAADMEQIQYQLQANQVSQEISRKDLANHKIAIEQSAALEAFLENKFTNVELYQWMITRIANVYFQTYSIAYELALAAERAYQFELNVNTSFINYGYWNNLQKGLTAGETLMLALNQMEKSFIDNNARTLEITRNISLLQLNPRALVDLVNTGECIVEFPESLFDRDYPGHYARKVKTISISIPAVIGPYQNIKASLTQMSSQVIILPNLNAVNYLLGGDDASMPGSGEMRSNWLVNQQIAISSGVNDAGMFELNFNDERYLPFEGTGAVSTWRLTMSPIANHLDFESISDVIFQLRYTAIDGGAKFRNDVIGLPAMKPYYGSTFLSLSTQYSTQWFEFLHRPSGTVKQDLSFKLGNLVPRHVDKSVLTGFYFQLDISPKISLPASNKFIKLYFTGLAQPVEVKINSKGQFTHGFDTEVSLKSVEGPCTIEFILADVPTDLKKNGVLNPELILDIKLILFKKGELVWR
jgi:hypothetical protein